MREEPLFIACPHIKSGSHGLDWRVGCACIRPYGDGSYSGRGFRRGPGPGRNKL